MTGCTLKVCNFDVHMGEAIILDTNLIGSNNFYLDVIFWLKDI